MLSHRVSLLAVLAVASDLAAQASWTRLYPLTSPPARSEPMMAADRLRGELILFGGRPDPSPSLDETWLWDGSNWRQLTPLARPPARHDGRMAWHEARQRIVLFGGVPPTGGFLQDTWEWDGTSWSQQFSPAVPAARSAQAMAYDPVRQRVVMFGGMASNFLGDVWEWNGSWTARSATGPSARRGAGMAFDPNSQTMLLFGGLTQLPSGGGVWVDETWLWNGTSWQQQFPANPPFPRGAHVLVTDEARSRVIVFGGEGSFDVFTWEWNGTNWQVVGGIGPATRYVAASAYDATRRELVLFGGKNEFFGRLFADTWVYRTATPARFLPYGTGCAGSAGTPVLANAPYSLPWLGDVFRTRVSPLPTGSDGVFFVTGVRASLPAPLDPFGFPGCTAHVTPDVADLRLAVGRAAEWSIVVPTSTAFVGAQLYQQALVLDPGAVGGAVVSNAGEIVAGIR